jgi:hypothetical protein
MSSHEFRTLAIYDMRCHRLAIAYRNFQSGLNAQIITGGTWTNFKTILNTKR